VHSAELEKAPNSIDQAGAGVWLNIVENDAHEGAGGLQNLQGAEHLLRESA
jgi:hypothetical protein